MFKFKVFLRWLLSKPIFPKFIFHLGSDEGKKKKIMKKAINHFLLSEFCVRFNFIKSTMCKSNYEHKIQTNLYGKIVNRKGNKTKKINNFKKRNAVVIS